MWNCLKCDWKGEDIEVQEDGWGNITRLCPDCGADDINHDLIKED